MRIYVQLKDHEDQLYSDFEWHFADNGAIQELKEEIEESFFIKKRHQVLWLNGAEVIGETLVDAGFKDEDVCVVKHFILRNWISFLSSCDKVAKRTTPKNLRKSLAYVAIQSSELLETSGLFLAYPELLEEWEDKLGQAMRYIDRTLPASQEGALEFFKKNEPGSSVDFEPKIDGIMEGTIAIVKKGQKVTRYYLKAYHKFGTANLMSASPRSPPDLLEIFLYRLLHVINYGPVAYFPFYSRSIFIYFIMTRELDGFKTADQIEDEERKSRLIVEVYVLRLILCISDLHGANFGLDETNKLSIIDFCPPKGDNFRQPDIVNDFKRASRIDNYEINEVLATVEPERRTEIGRAVLKRLSGILEVESNIIDEEKKMLREHGIKFNNGTIDIERYIKDIKENYKTLLAGLE